MTAATRTPAANEGTQAAMESEQPTGCYAVHETPGCGCQHCEDQVCHEGGRPDCCSDQWAAHCVELAQLYYDCGSCQAEDPLVLLAKGRSFQMDPNTTTSTSSTLPTEAKGEAEATALPTTTASPSSEDRWAVRPIAVGLGTMALVMLLNIWYSKKKERSSRRYADSKRNQYVELTTTDSYFNDFDLA